MTSVDITEYVRTRQAEIEAALAVVLPEPPRCPAVLARAMSYSLMAGGKRLRPVLCLASAEAVGGAIADAMPAACALELIHTYSLIHDDLPAMDNDTMRRGRPTLHVVVGEGMALLAGDGLLTEAFALMAREPRTTDTVLIARKLRALEMVATAAGVGGMAGGQAVDLAWAGSLSAETPAPLDSGALQEMHAMKTGALITAAAAAGAILGGGHEAQVAAIAAAAAELGLAFQIVDDILDVEGTSSGLGKTAGKDAAAGKPTYPALYGLSTSRSMAQDCLTRAAAALAGIDVDDSRLLGIGRWIVERSH